MPIAEPSQYLRELTQQLRLTWPDNRTVHLVFHGHSVPAGYFQTPQVQPFQAYPHLLHRKLRERFPFAVMNMIVTAVGGETSLLGAERFEREALCHRPDVVMIDYGLNDRRIGLKEAETSWRQMIEQAMAAGSKVILLTPTHDGREERPQAEGWRKLEACAAQIRTLAAEYGTGLADSFAAYAAHIEAGGDVNDLLSGGNHPNERGHELVAERLFRWFACW